MFGSTLGKLMLVVGVEWIRKPPSEQQQLALARILSLANSQKVGLTS